MDPSEEIYSVTPEKISQEPEMMDVVLETDAEVGASGYSVVGGGLKGIFIKEVLKDSPASKHLSLQKGDQLLSARVYFDNVKYEDALRILQCAEPYKVSFFLKRTVPQSELIVHPGAPTVELRGPKTKMQRMSVKSVKTFKAKKKRGGRFGLKRLKEKTKAVTEDNVNDAVKPAGGLDFTPVDAELAPKFKPKKHREVSAENLEIQGQLHKSKTIKKIRFPKIKQKIPAGDLETQTRPILLVQEIKCPQAKTTELESSLDENMVLRGRDAKLKPLSVELSVQQEQKKNISGKLKDTKKELAYSKSGASDIKAILPKVQPSQHSDKADVKATTKVEYLKKTKLKITTEELSLDGQKPSKVEAGNDDLSGRVLAAKHQEPLQKKHLPKVDVNVEGPEGKAGYGHTTPLSDAGKVFAIVYAFFGVPFTMLVLTACVQRLMVPVNLRPVTFLRRQLGLLPHTASMVHFVMLFPLVILVFLLLPALVFKSMERTWSFLEAFYFCFISLCTIGLGDFVPGEQPNQQFRPLYKISVMVYLFLGLMAMCFLLRSFHKLADVQGWTAFLRLPSCDEDDEEEHADTDVVEPTASESDTRPLDPSASVSYNSISR